MTKSSDSTQSQSLPIGVVQRKGTSRAGKIAFWGFVAFGAAMMTLMGVGLADGAKASSPGKWQESLKSVGITADEDTSERVRRYCVDGNITFDMIAEFEGAKQLVTVQCGYNGVTDAIVRYPKP